MSDERSEKMEARIEALEAQVEYLQGQVSVLIAVAGRAGAPAPLQKEDTGWLGLARALTKKQHAVLQMVVNGKDNRQVAVRLGVSESTAKGFLYEIMKHMRQRFGSNEVHTRIDAGELGQQMLLQMDDATYEAVAGIPKDWDAGWVPSDVKMHKHLYATKGSKH